MHSIIHQKRGTCFLCGNPAVWNDLLDEHHVFFGPYRKKSEEYGLKVYLHHNACHIFGENAVHVNAEVCRKLQTEVQQTAMRHYGWTIDEFIKLFGKNCIENVDTCVSCGGYVPEGEQVCAACMRRAENGKDTAL